MEMKLESGPSWQSFENFRTQGNTALLDVQPGKVGTLMTKHGQFRILNEADFQHLYGLARDLHRLSGTLRVVVAATRSLNKNRDDSSFETLSAAVMLLEDLPSLPLRTSSDNLEPEGIAADDVDDLDLDRMPRPQLGKAG
jgi:hypothetical protein